MDNYADYVCYLLGCQSAGIAPLEEWRFKLLQQEYLRHAAEAGRGTSQSDVPPFVLKQLALLIAKGYKIVAGQGSQPRPGDSAEEPGTAACGVREPRVPLEPVLVGSAARPLPHMDAPDLSFWRT